MKPQYFEIKKESEFKILYQNITFRINKRKLIRKKMDNIKTGKLSQKQITSS